MSTLTIKSAIQMFKAKKAKRKKNDDWASIEEPENFLKNFFLTVITLVITGVLGVLAVNILASPDNAMLRFAQFLHGYGDDFNKVYSAFSVAFMAMINLLVLIIFIMFGHSDEDDVVEMISDFDKAFNERIVETEHILGEKLDDIYIQLGDMLNSNGAAALTDEQIEADLGRVDQQVGHVDVDKII